MLPTEARAGWASAPAAGVVLLALSPAFAAGFETPFGEVRVVTGLAERRDATDWTVPMEA